MLEMLQARVEALLKGECEPAELAARSVALQHALQSLAGAGLVSAPFGSGWPTRTLPLTLTLALTLTLTLTLTLSLTTRRP